MAFKVLSWFHNADMEHMLESACEDLPYDLIVPSPDTDWCSARQAADYMDSVKPAAVIGFLPATLGALDDHYLDAAKCIASLCARHQLPWVQQSSYRVAGEVCGNTGLSESVPEAPEDRTGKQLHRLETAVTACPTGIVLRCGWLLDGDPDGIIVQMGSRILARDASLVVSDHHFGNPVPRRFVVRSVLAMVQQALCGAENWGVFNLHSSDSCSEAEFADQLVRLVNSEWELDVSLPVVATRNDARTALSGCGLLDGRRCTDDFGIQLPTWRKGLKGLVKKMLQDHPELNPG